ncbi:MAG: hypothetical protein BWY52_00319 [Chloroflexi bacterium ADurb.Bin325]|nr:MAG: hypothetical protein BWY52_00319 [Chloroflexi bacterium ADurb.Bin325]
MTRSFIKAGVFGGIAMLALNLLGLIPLISLCVLPLSLVAYAATGALAASWMPPPRTSGAAAGQGALAGLITGLIAGLLQAALTPVSFALAGGAQTLLSQLPAESLQQFEELGINPEAVFGPGVFAAFALVCCLPLTLLLGAGLGALGGVIYAAVRSENMG